MDDVELWLKDENSRLLLLDNGMTCIVVNVVVLWFLRCIGYMYPLCGIMVLLGLILRITYHMKGTTYTYTS